jgi:hypothetical protein
MPHHVASSDARSCRVGGSRFPIPTPAYCWVQPSRCARARALPLVAYRRGGLGHIMLGDRDTSDGVCIRTQSFGIVVIVGRRSRDVRHWRRDRCRRGPRYTLRFQVLVVCGIARPRGIIARGGRLVLFSSKLYLLWDSVDRRLLAMEGLDVGVAQ